MKPRRFSIRTIPARWWAFAYLSLIPGCALIYHLLPRLDPGQFHFYHASTQYEKVLYNDAESLISKLQEVLIQNFKETYHADSTQENGWTIAIKDMKISGLRPREDTVEIHFRMRLQKDTSTGPIAVANISFQASVPITGQDTIFFDDSIVCKPLLFDTNKLNVYNNEYFSFATIFVSPKKLCSSPSLVIPRIVNDRLKGFWRATRGFPTAASGSFWRMLYFSAMTITTVGYGDIYPISNIARLLVAGEAISGVVLAGLFLNAIVQERQTRN